MEKRGIILIDKGEYALKNAANKKIDKDIVFKFGGIFYSTEVKDGKIICSDKTISEKVEVWW